MLLSGEADGDPEPPVVEEPLCSVVVVWVPEGVVAPGVVAGVLAGVVVASVLELERAAAAAHRDQGEGDCKGWKGSLPALARKERRCAALRCTSTVQIGSSGS